MHGRSIARDTARVASSPAGKVRQGKARLGKAVKRVTTCALFAKS